MKIKAKISFCGVLSMGKGEVREYSDEAVLSDLLRAGYVEKVEETPEEETPGEAEKTSKEPDQEIAPAQKQKKKKAVKADEGK